MTATDRRTPPDRQAPSDQHGAQVVRSATAPLAAWNAAGVLAAADVHIVERLVRACREPVSDTAKLGAAFAVRAVRNGSTCLALDDIEVPTPQADETGLLLPAADELRIALLDSPLVAGGEAGPLRPLVLMGSADGPLVYLQKYFRQERTIREILATRAETMPVVDAERLRTTLDAAFAGDPRPDTDLQRLATALAATRLTTVLAGGPGTGKTTTVARILQVLTGLHGPGLRIGLCAPTGRAAAQLQASVIGRPGVPATVRAVTVHSLLGWRPGSSPRYGRLRTLPHDVIIVDETSMFSMTAMSRLLEAVRPDARVIFVGDPHQLASVEAGAVLADLVERISDAPTPAAAARAAQTAISAADVDDLDDVDRTRLDNGVITLRRGFRFEEEIARVAAAVNAGDADTVLALITSESAEAVRLVDPGDLSEVQQDVQRWGAALGAAATAGDADAALDALDAHRVLCAHREGSWGVRGWSARIAEWLGHDLLDEVSWYAGQPILVTANDKQTGTFNGDTGVVIADTEHGGVQAVFRRGDEVQPHHPTQLADIVPVYAMTIHRSQGSQFRRVTVVLPSQDSALLTRELLYTAITRAQKGVRIIGDAAVLRAAVERRVQRASGLRSAVSPLT